MMCKCNGCGGHGEQRAFQRLNVALWEAAQADAADLSYVEAVALAGGSGADEDHDRYEQEVTDWAAMLDIRRAA